MHAPLQALSAAPLLAVKIMSVPCARAILFSSYFHQTLLSLTLTFLRCKPGLKAQPLGEYLNQYLHMCIFQFTGRSGSIFDLLLQGPCTS